MIQFIKDLIQGYKIVKYNRIKEKEMDEKALKFVDSFISGIKDISTKIELEEAIQKEDYERAAELRDKLNKK